MDEAKKLSDLEQENEELKRELRELFKTLDQMNQSLNRMIDHYILCKTEKSRKADRIDKMKKKRLIYNKLRR